MVAAVPLGPLDASGDLLPLDLLARLGVPASPRTRMIEEFPFVASCLHTTKVEPTIRKEVRGE